MTRGSGETRPENEAGGKGNGRRKGGKTGRDGIGRAATEEREGKAGGI